MSAWSYVSGVIEVDTYARSNAEAMYLAQTVVNHLPKIDGSEGCAKYYLNLIQGNNSSSNADEFLEHSNLARGETWHGLFEWQTRVLITVDGALRDVGFDRAVRDTVKMLSRLSSRLSVMNCLVRVLSYGRETIINNPDWVINREMTDWARNLVWGFAYEKGGD